MLQNKLTLIVISIFLLANCSPETQLYKPGTKTHKPSFNEYHVDDATCSIDSLTVDRIYAKNQSHFDALYYDRLGLEDYCKLFAGKYIAIDMSQGSETVCTYIFDCATGEMFESPLFMYSSAYKPDSRLYVKDPTLTERQQKECEGGIFDCNTKYFFWDEKEHLFKAIE